MAKIRFEYIHKQRRFPHRVLHPVVEVVRAAGIELKASAAVGDLGSVEDDFVHVAKGWVVPCGLAEATGGHALAVRS